MLKAKAIKQLKANKKTATKEVTTAQMFKFFKKLANKAELKSALKAYKKNSEYYAATFTISPYDFALRFSSTVNLIATKNYLQTKYAADNGIKISEKTPDNKINKYVWGSTHWSKYGLTNIDGKTVHQTFSDKNKAIIDRTNSYAILTQYFFTCIDIDDPKVNLTIEDLLAFSDKYLNGAPIVYQTSSFGKKMHIFVDASKFPYKDGVKNFQFFVNNKCVNADIRGAKGYARIASDVENRYGDFKFLFNLKNEEANANVLKQTVGVDTYNKIANDKKITGLLSYSRKDLLNLLPQLPVANDKLAVENSMCLVSHNQTKSNKAKKQVNEILKNRAKVYRKSIEELCNTDKETNIEISKDPLTWYVNSHRIYNIKKLKKCDGIFAGYEEGNRNNFFYCLFKFGLAKCGLVYRQNEFRRFVAKVKDLNNSSKDIVEPLPNSEIEVIAGKLWNDAKNGYIKGLTLDQFKLLEQGTGVRLTFGHLKASPRKGFVTVKQVMDKYGSYYDHIYMDYLDRPVVIEKINGKEYVRFVQKIAIDKKTCNFNESFEHVLNYEKTPYQLHLDIQIRQLKKNTKLKHVHNNFKSDFDNIYPGEKDVEHIEKIKKLRTYNNKDFFKLAFQDASEAEALKDNYMHTTYSPIIPNLPNFKNVEHALYRDAVLNVNNFVDILNVSRQRTGRFKKDIHYVQTYNILNECKSIRNKLFPHDINYMKHIITLAAVIKQKRKLKAFEQKDLVITQIENILTDLFKIEDHYNELHNYQYASYTNIIEERRKRLFDGDDSILTKKEASDLLYLRIDKIMDMYQYGFEYAPKKAYIFSLDFGFSLHDNCRGRKQALSFFKQEKSLNQLITEHMINLRNQLKIEKEKMIDKIYKIEGKSKQANAKENALNQDVIKQCYAILAQLDDSLQIMHKHDWMLSMESPIEPMMVKVRSVKRIFDSNRYEWTEGKQFYRYLHKTIECVATNLNQLNATQLAILGLRPSDKKYQSKFTTQAVKAKA